MTDHSWRDRAACTNAPGIDFTAVRRRYLVNARDGRLHPAYAAAIPYCHTCPVRTECRREALERADIAGLAGGTLEPERRAWRQQHGIRVQTWTANDNLTVAEQMRMRTPAGRVPVQAAERVEQLAAAGIESTALQAVLGIDGQDVERIRRVARRQQAGAA